MREMSFDALQVGCQARDILVECNFASDSECWWVSEKRELCSMHLESVHLLMMERMSANDVLGTEEFLSRAAEARVGREWAVLR